MKVTVLLTVLVVTATIFGHVTAADFANREQLAQLVTELLQNTTAPAGTGAQSSGKNPLEEVLELFYKLIEKTEGELVELLAAHEKQAKAAQSEISALESQYNAEVDKCHKNDDLLTELRSQQAKMEKKVEKNEVQIKTNQENIIESHKTQCKNGHDFFYSLKSLREGIDLLIVVRQLISDHWVKQSQTNTLLEDQSITHLVSGLLPNLIALPYVAGDAQFNDIIAYVEKYFPKTNKSSTFPRYLQLTWT